MRERFLFLVGEVGWVLRAGIIIGYLMHVVVVIISEKERVIFSAYKGAHAHAEWNDETKLLANFPK